jgi:protein O-mannosyl-transferase
MTFRSFSLPHLFGINPFNTGGYYRPIPAVYFSILWNLFGDTAFFYHFMQIMLHSINACLLFYLLKRFFSKALSFFLTLIFLVHPIQVESVAYIGATQSELLFVFGISALLMSMKEKLHIRELLLISFFLLLSLLTKETGFLFLLMILLYRFLFYRVKTGTVIPYLLLPVIFYAVIRFGYAKVFLEKNVAGPIGDLSFTERLLNIPAVVFYYLKTFFYPAQLVIDQRWIISAVDFNRFYFPLLISVLFFVLSGIGGYIIYKKESKQFRTYLFFFVWFVIGLGLHIQLYPLDMTVADRWFYFPIVGLLGMLGVLFHLLIKGTSYQKIWYVVAVFIVLLLSVRTVVRNTNWHDALMLYLHDSRIRTSFDLENNLGVTYANRGDYKDALPHFLKSSQLFPYASSTFNIGLVYEQYGMLKKAKKYYVKALRESLMEPGSESDPTTIPVRIASVSVRIDKPYVTVAFIKSQLNYYPDTGLLWMYLAMARYKLHEQKAALQAAENAKKFYPSLQTEYVYTQILHKRPVRYDMKS